MVSGLLGTFVRHRVAANLLMILLILLGLFSLGQINRQLFPRVGLDAINVNLTWPGASASDVEQKILKAIEPEVRFLDGIRRVNATAFEGRGNFFIEFRTGTNMARALSDVESAIARVTTLPEDMENVVISQAEFYEPVARLMISGPFSEASLKAIARHMRDDLLDRGIDKVNIDGMRDDEIRVEIPPDQLQQLNMTLADVAGKISSSSIDQPSGRLAGATERQLRLEGEKETAETIGDIALRALPNGEMLQIEDVAHVTEAFDRTQHSGFYEGRRALSIAVLRAEETDSIVAAGIINTYLLEARAKFPETLEIIYYDVRSNYIRDRISLMVKNGLGGLFLVVSVLFLFLSGRVAFWVAMGIPVALMGTFFGIYLLGETFNMMSLMALIMTLGIIVDDAIVVGEHAATLRQRGESPLAAAEHGAKMMFSPVLAASLTTVAAFLPILLISDTIGQMVRALPLVVITVLIASLIECFLILPAHMRHALARDRVKERAWREKFNRAFDRFRDGRFRRLVAWCYHRRYVTIAAAVALLIVGINLRSSGHVGFTFAPTPEPETLLANVVFAPGTPRDQTERMLVELERSLKVAERQLTGGTYPLVKTTFATLGKSQARENWMSVPADNLGGMYVELVPGDERAVRNRQIINAWREEARPVAGLERFAVIELMGGPPGRDLDIRLSGADIATLKAAALEIRDLLASFPGVSDVEDDLPYGKRDWVLTLTPRGQALGFTTESVARQIRFAAEGGIARRFARGEEEVIIRVQHPENSFTSESLRRLYVKSSSGAQVPLMEVVHIEEKAGFARIRRYNGVTEVAVNGEVDAQVTNANMVLAALPADGLDDIAKKYGIHYQFRGKAEEQAQSFGELGAGIGIALALIYIILAWALASYSRPIVVMSIIPFGIVGAIFGHLVMGYNLTILSMVGLLGLSGILVNDSIILVTAIERRRLAGQSLRNSVVAGAQDRLRAVLLTSLTTIGGLAPLMFETSLQAQFLIPMAITIVFGIALATALVLLLVPAVIGAFEDGRRGFRKLRDKGYGLWLHRRVRGLRPPSAAPERPAE